VTPRAAGALILTGALLCLVLAAGLTTQAVSSTTSGSLAVLLLHAVLFLAALGIGLWRIPGCRRLPLALCGAACLVFGGIALVSGTASVGGQHAVVYAHVVAGVVSVGLLARVGISLVREPRSPWVLRGVVACGLLLLAGYGVGEYRRVAWSPPRYDAQACYRFLTATTAQQSGEPHFPSAIRIDGNSASNCAPCHSDTIVSDRTRVRHGAADASAAYRRTYADFVKRRGREAGVWCQGCHSPGSVTASDADVDAKREAGYVNCAACHGATDVHALYGNAALAIRGQQRADSDLRAVMVRRKYHSQRTLRPDLHRSAEFCGSCHRKNWSLPQNGYHWMPGPDELGQWQSSAFAPGALFAPGERKGEKSCLGCHDAHQPDPPRARPAMTLDAFVRRGPGFQLVEPLERARTPGAGDSLRLDIVVRNAGVGHDFPTGMPDLWETWLEVIAFERSGRPRAHSGDAGPEGAHTYRLIGLDRGGKPIVHGDLDRMTSVLEWRRIPSGAADVARYALTSPRAGLGGVRVRLLRRRRPDFSRWAGETEQVEPTVLAEIVRPFIARGVATPEVMPDEPQRWRNLGLALASVKSYPEALQALNHSLKLRADDPETLLALGGVYLEEGDLLAAREQFQQAQRGEPERGRAWEGAVLRRMQQADEAAALLRPLAQKHPRDLRLRFELGSAYLAALRNADAAREFEAMLDVDPTDVSAHYNLMLCFQRMNRITDARREETTYRLLRPETRQTLEAATSVEATALHVHALETVP